MKFDVIVTPNSVFLNGEKLRRKNTGGSSRKIYMGKEYVLKLETDGFSDRQSLWQCRREYKLWKIIPKRDKKYFAPILAYKHTKNYDYVVQPRLKLISKGSMKKITKAWEKISKIIDEYDFNDIMTFDDIVCNNWGLCNGEPIIHDYGL